MTNATAKDYKWLKFCEEGARIFSTCAKRQFMAVIIDDNGRIAGQGYNGVPPKMQHCADGGCPRYANNVPSGTPYDSGPGLCYSGHAEVNALSHGDGTRYPGATLYVNGLPCLTCAKSVASAGIKRMVSRFEGDRIDADEMRAFFKAADVEFVELML